MNADDPDSDRADTDQSTIGDLQLSKSRSEIEIDMDFYIVLGVDRGAPAGDIKRAYKRLARRLHPDINPGDHEAAARFRQVLDAYETLMDPDRRRRYDAGQLSSAGRRRVGDVRLRRL